NNDIHHHYGLTTPFNNDDCHRCGALRPPINSIEEPLMQRDGKVAIVTGVSSGIGQASAKALHQAGFRVFGTNRHAVAGTLNGITMVTCDVTDDTSVKTAVDKVIDTTGRIDVLVNNA